MPARAWASPSASSSSQRRELVVGERQRDLVLARRLLERKLDGGSVAGAARVLDRLVGHAKGGGGHEVLRELGEMRLRIG